MRHSFTAFGVLVIVCLGLVHCERDIAIDYSGFKPLLVIHSQLSPDSTIEIAVSSSASPISSQQGEMPEGVLLQLLDLTDNKEIALTKTGGKFVSAGNYPAPGHTYRLTASADGFDPVSAVITVPDHILVRNVEVRDYEESQSVEDPRKRNISFDLSIAFENNAQTYLHVLFQQEYQYLVDHHGQPDIFATVFPVEPQFPEEQGLVSHHEQGVLVSFDRVSSDELTFSFVDYIIRDSGSEEQLGELSIEVRTVSREYYLFFESLSRQLISRQDPFAEPIPTFNNIHDGLGNFSAFQTETYTLPIQ
jgi:hypothetical protein